MLDMYTCVQVLGYVNRVVDVESNVDTSNFTMQDVESNLVRCPDQDAAQKMVDGECFKAYFYLCMSFIYKMQPSALPLPGSSSEDGCW